MFFFDLLFVFIFIFVLFCFAFTYYHQNKHCLQQSEVGVSLKNNCLLVIGLLWRVCSDWLQTLDRFLIKWLAYFFADYWNTEKYCNAVSYYINDTCVTTWEEGNTQDREEISVKREIQELSNTICELYIDFWYQNVQLDEGQIDEANFKFYCRRNIEEALFNFYNICATKLSGTNDLSCALLDQIKSHLHSFRQNELSDEINKLKTKSEIALLLDFVDDIFRQVLPSDVNSLLTNCHCCRNGKTKRCLQESSNAVRLFIYNLLIYSLLLPLIDRLTNPLYCLYHFINLYSNLGGISLDEFMSHFKKIDDNHKDLYNQQIESQPVPVIIESEDISQEKTLLYEAIEESKMELMVFSNIHISNVKISNNEVISTISKMNPYIDYIIVYNVLECDRQNERQKIILKKSNKQTFLPKTYQVKRRFREFLSFQQKLEKNVEYKAIIAKITNKPSNIQFHSSTFLNYIKSTKITEDSPLVKLRRDCLESFLNQLSKHKAINESKEFCEFLGYKFKLLYEVKHLINENLSIDLDKPDQGKSTSKNFELNLKNIKDIFKIFMPPQAKYGQLSTQIEDVMVNEQVCNKYSIMKIQTECNDQNQMVLKLKLDRWISSNAYPPSSNDFSSSNQSNHQNSAETINHKLTTCLFSLIFKESFIFQNYITDRLSKFLYMIFIRFWNIFIFRNVFKYYLHYLHNYLTGMENDSIDTYLVSYDRFYNLFKDRDLTDLFDKYKQYSESKILERCAQTQNTCRLYLCRFAFYLCDHFSLFDNIITSFDNQQTNKLLLYKLMQIFRNKINA